MKFCCWGSGARGRREEGEVVTDSNGLGWPRLDVSRQRKGRRVIAVVQVQGKRGGRGREQGTYYCNVVDRVVGGRALGNARNNVKCWIRMEERAAEVGEV
jgi:hypothetical protein